MYHLRTLGSPQLKGPYGDVSLRLREAALLAFMCEQASKAVSRETIARLLWPRVQRERALRSLSQLLYQLRRRIPDVPINCTTESIGLVTTCSDLDDLRCAVAGAEPIRVLELFRGPFLGTEGSPSHALDQWREQLNREVASAVSEALEQCMAGVASLDDTLRIMQCCERLTQNGLASASDYCLFIIACIKAGRQQRAQHLYSEMWNAFADTATLPTFDSLAAVVARVEDSRGLDRAVRFVGRGEELQQLLSMWRCAVRGEGQVITILGEPGIGKTRLAEQVMRRAALAGSQTWITRCYAGRRRVRFSAIADLLRENFSNDGSLTREIAETVSFLTHPWATGALHHQYPVDQWHYRMLETLTRLVDQVAQVRPLTIFVDDVQWADDFTAQLLTLWALKIPKWRVMLIMTVRTEDAEPPPDWLFYELAATSTMVLGQLSIESASELVKSYEAQAGVCLSSARRNQILWQSAGRPFLLIEGLVSAAREGNEPFEHGRVFLPESAEALLLRRFRGLSNDAGWLAGILAALGSAIEPDIVVRLSGIADNAAAAALESLSVRGIIVLEAGKLDYPHDLMRETAYRHLAPATRTLIHQHIAEALAAQEWDVGVLAQHFAKSSSRYKAGRLALKAAEGARANSLYSDCEFYYRLAIDAGSQEEKHVAVRGLARVLVQTGRTHEIEPFLTFLREQTQSRESLLLIQLFELEQVLASENVPISELMRRARHLTGMAAEAESSDLAVVLGMLLDIAHVAGNTELGRDVLRAFTSTMDSRQNGDFGLQIEILTSIWEGTTAGYDTALRRLRSTGFEGNSDVTPLTLMSAWFAMGTLLLLAGRLIDSKESFLRAMELAQTAGELRRLCATYMNSAVTMIELGEYDEARRMLDNVLASPNRAHRLRACTNLAILHYEGGENALALSAAQAVMTANASYGSTTLSAVAPAIAGLVHLRNNDVDLARDRLSWLQKNSQEINHLSGDASYTLSFVARMKTIDGSGNEALRILDAGIARSVGRDRMCVLRLLCTKAEILSTNDGDKAYGVAKAVLTEALTMQAKPIAARAKAVLAETRV